MSLLTKTLFFDVEYDAAQLELQAFLAEADQQRRGRRRRSDLRVTAGYLRQDVAHLCRIALVPDRHLDDDAA
jgi:hypothetical protein